jgi:beta-1,4-mannosyl-glycoprotein beta-1,4-N-acetylglucosaminyltransferase
MKIFDCFLFFNELDLLDLRLMTLGDFVDNFVLVEANKTFTGRDKDFLFEKNKSKYKKYLDKIIHIKVTDTPNLRKTDPWIIENYQRNSIMRGLAGAKAEDRIMVSDVDEIPDPVRVKELLERRRSITFNQRLFYYYVNCLAARTWNGTIITPFWNMTSPQKLREKAKRGVNRVENSGWHYSYLGGLDRIRLKLDNLSDAYIRMSQVGTDEDIIRKMDSLKDLWDESVSHKIINIEDDNYSPKCMKEFIIKYPYVFYNNTA